MNLDEKITISQQGVVDKDLFLALLSTHQGFPFHTSNEDRLDIVDRVGLDWNLPGKGKLLKRFSKYIYQKYNTDLTPEYLEQVGNKLSASLMKWDLEVRFQKLEWNTRLWCPGDYGDTGSCYFGGRKGAVTMMREAGNFYIILITKEGDKFARAWMEKIDEENFVFFNLYSVGNKLVGLALAQQLAKHFGLPYKKINLVNQGSSDGELWINQSSGYWIGNRKLDKDSSDNEYYDFNLDEIQEDENDEDDTSNYVTCSCCGYEGNEDNFYYDYNGERICEDCKDSDYYCCEINGEYYPYELVSEVNASVYYYGNRLYYNIRGFVNTIEPNQGEVRKMIANIRNHPNNQIDYFAIADCYDKDDDFIGSTETYFCYENGKWFLSQRNSNSLEIEIENEKELCFVKDVKHTDGKIQFTLEYPYAPQRNCIVSEGEKSSYSIVLNRKEYELKKNDMLYKECHYIALNYPFVGNVALRNLNLKNEKDLIAAKTSNGYYTSYAKVENVDDNIVNTLFFWDGESNHIVLNNEALPYEKIDRYYAYKHFENLSYEEVKASIRVQDMVFTLKGYKVSKENLIILSERSKSERFTKLEQIERYLQEEEGELVSRWVI